MTEFLNKLYIDGEWCDGAAGETFEVINPADESVLTSVASGNTGFSEKSCTMHIESFFQSAVMHL